MLLLMAFYAMVSNKFDFHLPSSIVEFKSFTDTTSVELLTLEAKVIQLLFL
jgi:hypothetical protein